MIFQTPEGKYVLIAIVCTAVSALMLIAAIIFWAVERRHELEWAAYMDEYAPGWRGSDE